jgi:DNA-binding response OmpR family regulator
MPEKEGIALITELRRERKDVKVVAMSGSGQLGNMDFLSVATTLGANVLLHKPFDDLQLINAVRALLDRAPATPAPGSSSE